MQITVKGRNLAVPEELRQEAVEKLSKVKQVFDRVLDVQVVLSQDHNPRIVEKVHCEVTFHVKGRMMRASAAGPDPHTAIDRVQAKVIRQARRHKNKMIDSHRGKRGVDVPA